ncbi:penicillin acylase family protein [Nocardioides sp. cx-173]|uniref:penicillin acylase family protein n=1 Tax=Nocardioides sp. cx-173 TaxID=2898796 RepID=UPI001E658522|nr:penicillin acylase family protein [Nocardioides sp. cx-173]MCD4527435.1 penicillin acylase family protein [Nocardioides sp. cx-173]UGB41002.1 penicillin acylase family protein [Nocardioides sp. cx-173]
MARFYRDAYGVPHVRAQTVQDLARGQGEITARDRTWQLEWLRRRASGTTAEVFGSSAVGWDRLARRTLLAHTARRAHAALNQETRAFLAAYVDGVNAGLRTDVHELEVLGLAPEPWEEWTPLAVFLAQHLLFANLGGKLWAQAARDALGPDAALLSHEGPQSSGSNAWAVGGARTRSGLPLIGGDPHRVIEAPGIYQQVRLACEDPDDPFDVVGLAFPGVPGVPHFGHAGDVAWAITNACADYQDVYAEPTPYDVVERWTETVSVRDGEPVEVEVVVTPRGPVFEDGLSLRTASGVLGDLGFDAILPLLRARTVDDVDRALDHWVEPVNNVVIADRAGVVRYRIAGRVPLRDDGNRRGVVAPGPDTEWDGWLAETNRVDVPVDGQVVTANERRGPESDAVGTVFVPPYRAERIRALLTGRDGLGPEDFAAIHDDSRLATVAILRTLVPGAFDGWDGDMRADSREAGAFAAWRSALVRRIAAEPVFTPLHESRHDPVLRSWLDVTARIALALPSLVAHGTPYGIDLARHAREALAETAGVDATWGETHVATPVHAFEAHGLVPPPLPALPVSGDSDCVRCTGSLPGITDEAFRGSVARYVWDLADREASAWVVPLGASGDPRDAHHHDQLALWADGRLAPVVTDWARLTEEP